MKHSGAKLHQQGSLKHLSFPPSFAPSSLPLHPKQVAWRGTLGGGTPANEAFVAPRRTQQKLEIGGHVKRLEKWALPKPVSCFHCC